MVLPTTFLKMDPIFKKIEVQLNFSVVLVSHVQQSDSYTYMPLFRFFFLVSYYKISNIVPCYIEQILV